MKLIKIGLVHPHKKAFYPESTAYKNYFTEDKGFQVCVFDSVESADVSSDIIIYYCGFFPFWKKTKSKLILEYHSLSVSRISFIKNIAKRLINRTADGYIFLNQTVREKYFFSKKLKYRYRGMGYFPSTKDSTEKIYDIVYMGSLGRHGVKESIIKLASLNFSVIVIGCSEEDKLQISNEAPNVMCLGRLSQSEVSKIASTAKFGLNFTPDIYPLNIQDSTKVIEYCGLGLGVITNRYKWLDDFESSINASFLTLDAVLALSENEAKQLVFSHTFSSGNIYSYQWDQVIKISNIEELILESIR